MTARLPTAAHSAHSLYKRTLSPLLHSMTGTAGACRFQPTCSEYAVLAVEKHGWIRGGWLAIVRVLRCSPLSRGGFDPVPGTWPVASPPQSGRETAGETEGKTGGQAGSESSDSCRVGPRQLP